MRLTNTLLTKAGRRRRMLDSILKGYNGLGTVILAWRATCGV
jgi:hypothetical protein